MKSCLKTAKKQMFSNYSIEKWQFVRRHTLVIVIGLMTLCVAGCSRKGSTVSNDRSGPLSGDEKHRLYSAALAASESPLDTDTFKAVCQRIGIFDAAGKPNDQYMVFVSQHVDWGTKFEADEFRREINTKEKARAYIARYLGR